MLHSVSIENIMPLGIRIWYYDHLRGEGWDIYPSSKNSTISRVGHMLAMAPRSEK